MASRDYLKHVVATSEPTNSALGDEYYNSSSNKLFKRLAVNGTAVNFVPVLLNPSPDSRPLVIDSAGNLGIGIATPAANLHINNSTAIGNVFLIDALGGQFPNFVMRGSGEQTFRFHNTASTGSTRVSWKMADRINPDWRWIMYTDLLEDGAESFTIRGSTSGHVFTAYDGKVGVGTAAPSAKFDVVANTTYDALKITQTGTGNALLVEDSANPDATPTVIDASGNIGIGISPPVAKLDVYAASGYVDARVRSGSNQTYIAADGTAAYFGTYSNIPVILSTNNVNRGGISNAGVWSLGAPAGSESLRVTPVASSVNYLEVTGGVTGAPPQLRSSGTNIPVGITGSNTWAGFANAAAAVGVATDITSALGAHVVIGSLNGNAPYVGSSNFSTSSNNGLSIRTNGVLQFLIANTASAVNYLQATGGATGTGPTLSAAGSDANINITLSPKGTGTVIVSKLQANESLSIATNTTPAVFIKDDNLTSWEYSGKSKSVTAEETAPTGIFFKPDGTEMYIIGSTGDDVNQYTLSTAWDVSTATFTRVSAAIGDTGPSGVFFKPDGTIMYTTGTTNDSVREFSLSIAWNVSTITFVREFIVSAQDTSPNDLWFKPDGTKMYIVGSTNDRIYEYNLSTAWNVSTAVFLQFFSVATQETVPIAVNFNPDGTKMYVLGAAGVDINRYTLSTPWNISTAVFFNNFYVGFQEAGPNGLFINFSTETAYVVGTSADTVFQYSTLTDGIELNSSSGLFIDGSLYTNKNLIVTSSARIDGTLSVSGAISGPVAATTISATSTINLAGTTTSVTSLGTAATTGTTTVGGLLQTGVITVGQSTSAQTLNLATGATLNATTKIINIGTAGVSGSITNINIGSAVAGSTGTTTLDSRLTTPFQITSTLATGTAPFAITSTTRVANLNVATAGTSDSTTAATSFDTRSTATTPESFGPSVRFDFKANTTNSLADGGTYNGAMYWRKYGVVSDWTGGGAVELAYTDNARLWMRYGASATWGAWKRVLFGDNFDNGGNVRFTSLGVNTAASGTAGEIRATNEITAYFSDERLKTFDGKITNALQKVNSLSGYYFYENELAKSLGYTNDKRQVGVSAQEVERILPEAVAPAPVSSEYLTVKYEKLVPLLIEAIKAQQIQIESQQAQIDELKALTSKQ